MTKHQEALAAAVADLGKRELPLGSNTGEFVISCQRATWLGGTGWPWCRGATLKWRKQAGDKPGDGSAGAWDALNRAKKRGEALTPAEWAKVVPGDEVVFNIGSGHVALVESVNSTAVTSIGGNESDGVRRGTRPLSYVRGFIAWPELGVQAGGKRPRFQVVGSVSGTRKLVVGGKTLPLPGKDKVT